MTTQLDVFDGQVHPEEGILQGWVDGEISAEETRRVAAHVERCVSCRDAASELQTRSAAVSRAVEIVGVERVPRDRPTLDRARWEIRRRRSRSRGWRRGGFRRNAAAASILVLLAGGAAAALPGSPLRSLFVGDGGRSGGAEASSGSVVAATGASGVGISFREGRAEVTLDGAAVGRAVEFEIGSGDRVEVLAPEGARFRAGGGSVTVDLADAAPGEVTIRIPLGPGEVDVLAGTRILARWSAGAFRFGEGVPADPRSDGVTIRIPELVGGGDE